MNLEARVKQLEMQVGVTLQNMAQLENKYIQMVNHFNQQVARIDGVDTVAYAAITLHDGKEFKLTEKGIKATDKHMKKIDATMEAYRKKKAKENGDSTAQQRKDS